MSGLRKILGNTFISLFGQLVTWSSTLLLTIAYGRFLGDLKLGELYLALSLVSLIGFPVEFGFNQQLTRDVAQEPKKAESHLWNTLLIKTTLWILSYGIILLTAWVLGYDQEQRTLVAICGLGLLSGSIVNAFAALHYAFEQTVYPSVGLMLEKGLSALIGFIVLKMGASVEVMALILLGGSLIDALWVAFWFFRRIGRRIIFDMVTLRQLLRTSIPFIVYGVLGVIYYRIDTILLSLMASTVVVGWYGAGYRLFDTLLFIPNLILNAVMYPVFSKLAGKSHEGTSRETLRVSVEKCMNLLLICSFPIAFFMIAGAPSIIGFLYHSSDFINTIPVVQALAPGLIFLYINTLFNSVIISTKGEKKIPIMAAAALVFNLGLNLLLIPRYQQIAAAAVTSLTELLLLCISSFFVPKYLFPRKSIKTAVKTFIAALVMGAIIFYLNRLSVLLLLPVGMLTYTSLTILFRTLPREDIQTLLKAIRDRKRSVEMLTTIAEENVFSQFTDPRLPTVKLARVPVDVPVAPDGTPEDDEVTLTLVPIDKVATYLLPSIDEVATLSLASIRGEELGEEEEDEATLRRLGRDKRNHVESEMGEEEDDEATLRLPAIKHKKGFHKIMFQ